MPTPASQSLKLLFFIYGVNLILWRYFFSSSFCSADNFITDKYSLLFLKALPWSYVTLLHFYSTLVCERHFQVRRLLWQPCTAPRIYLSISSSQMKFVRRTFQLRCLKIRLRCGEFIYKIFLLHYLWTSQQLTLVEIKALIVCFYVELVMEVLTSGRFFKLQSEGRC